MKITFRHILLVLLPTVVLGFCNSIKKDSRSILVDDVLQILKSNHYKPLEVDDTLSDRVYNLFLDQLDERKIFFTEKDIEGFEKYRYQLDDEIKKKSFVWFDNVTEIYQKRVKEAATYSNKGLEQKFAFDLEETIDLPDESRKASEDGKKLCQYWGKYIHFLVLDNYARKLILQEDASKNGDTAYKQQPVDTLLKKAISETDKNQKEWFKRLIRLEEKDYFNMYINAIASAFDPHTGYFPPREKEDFDIKLSGQFEGIGASLSERDGYIKVENIIPGSASYRQGELKAGDLIIAVGQDKEDPINTIDMSINDVVQLIRGKKGTVVALTVKRPDASTKIIHIIRDVVVLEEGYAKSALIDDEIGKIGYINLPSFYADFNRNGGRSSAEDVANEVLKLNKDSIKGLVIDLRYNGGGSLQDVVEMVGLFTGRGPAVQIKGRDGRAEVYSAHTPNAIYTGPLIVLVNYYSASASEILAAALQDYGRAVIIGTKHTFGKGTVQTFKDLGSILSDGKDGAIKLTTQKFYRINGGTTQFMGVLPDIVIPDRFDFSSLGERDLDYPLMNDNVNSAIPPKQIDNKMQLAIENSRKRVLVNPIFENQTRIANYLNSQNKANHFSLNLNKYKAYLLETKEKQNALDTVKEHSNLRFTLPKVDKMEMQSDTLKLRIRREWAEGFKKDGFLLESVRVLKELQ